jgi:protein TonB
MRRLSLFFLLASLSVFGAIGAVVQHQNDPKTPGPIMRQKTITLSLYAPPKPETAKAKQPKNEKKRTAKPKPKPKPNPTPQPKPKPEAITVPEPKQQPDPIEPTPSRPEDFTKTETVKPKESAVVTQTSDRPQPMRSEASARNVLEEYYAKLYHRISRQKYYPPRAKRFGVEGEVGVVFVLDNSGRIVDATLLRESGRRCLDRAALEIFRQIGQFDKPPETMTKRRFEITIDYHLS